MRPASMYIWNVIRKWFQERIEDLGVEETSFPMFLSSKSLEKEKGALQDQRPNPRTKLTMGFLAQITSKASPRSWPGSQRRESVSISRFYLIY